MALKFTQPLTVPGIFSGGKGCRYVGLTTLPPSCADCLEIWEPQPPGTLRDCFTFTKHHDILPSPSLFSNSRFSRGFPTILLKEFLYFYARYMRSRRRNLTNATRVWGGGLRIDRASNLRPVKRRFLIFSVFTPPK